VDYQITQDPQPAAVSFADKVKLIALDYGRTRLDLAEPVDALVAKQAPAGHSLWLVLEWQTLTSVDFDLKTSLLLKDERGHLAGQVDDLLVGDHYPVFRNWETGEQTHSYHILPVLPAIPPGKYNLYLKVYEDQTGRIYPARKDGGQAIGTEAYLGSVEITRTVEPSVLSPDHLLEDPAPLAPGLALTGFDLPRTTLAPGDLLPVTLYWQASTELVADYMVSLQLLDQDGALAGEVVQRPGNDAFPTTEWRAGEVLRNWYDLAIRPEMTAGVYELMASLRTGDETFGYIKLSDIEVNGRSRLFAAPEISAPVEAAFAEQVRLLGVNITGEIRIAPGETITIPLVWQVIGASEEPLVRFVHLLGADGRPVAQQDTVPCEGQCPSTSWLAEEILLDPATLTAPAELPAGEYQLVAGWYDPATATRLAAVDGQGDLLENDVVVLPVSVEVR
jgi:hypothetical protein